MVVSYHKTALRPDERINVQFDGVPLDLVLKKVFHKKRVVWKFRKDTIVFTSIPPGELLVTWKQENIRAADFFSIIYDQTRFQAFYNDEQYSSDQRISVDFKDEPLDNVLASLLRKRRLSWYYRSETFVIYPQKPGEPVLGKLPEDDLIHIHGVVTNKNGEPLEYATVALADNRKGTQTDHSGSFSMTVSGPRAKIAVSRLGFVTRQLVVGIDPVKVILDNAVSGLDEVRVIGYGQTSKRTTTGAISRITTRDIERQPVTNVLGAMQGRIPGLSIIPLSGLPGSNFKVQLRGRNSIGSGNQPLFILDGVPLPSSSLAWDFNARAGYNFLPVTAMGLGANRSSSPLNVVNVADIESIDVLKDADATAIYGSRGANGVILMTTKRGKPSPQPVLNVNAYQGVGMATGGIQYLNTAQYLEMRNEAFRNDNAKPTDADPDVNGSWDRTRHTDWQKVFMGGTAHITDGQAAISGGNDRLGYRISGGFRRESTVYPGAFDYRKGGGRANIQFASPDNRWRVMIGAAYLSDWNYLPSQDLAFFSATIPNAPAPRNSDGSLQWQIGYDNPFAALLRVYKASTDNLLISANASYQLTHNLQFRFSTGFNRMTADEIQTDPAGSYNPVFGPLKGQARFADGRLKNWIIEPHLIYDKRKGPGAVSVLAGATFQKEGRSQRLLLGTDYNEDSQLEDIAGAGNLSVEGYHKTNYRYHAFFGRISYDYDGRYLINLTGRRDGSSKFLRKRYANFGAVAAAWIFIKQPPNGGLFRLISFGKIKGSHGVTGNDQIPDNHGLPGANRGNYTWERVTKTDLGLDLGFLENRLLISATCYRNLTRDQLVEDQRQGFNGPVSYLTNMDATVENKGLELEITMAILKHTKCSWEVSATYTLPKNKLLTLPVTGQQLYARFYTVGRSLDDLKGLRVDGVDPSSGLYQVSDWNNDGKIDGMDRQSSTTFGIQSYGALYNKLTVVGFELDCQWQFTQQKGYNPLFSSLAPGPGIAINQPVAVMGRWKRRGDITTIQRFSLGGAAAADAYAFAASSNYRVVRASYLSMKSVSISYALPEKWLRKTGLNSGRLYFLGQNLFTFSRFAGRSPEQAIIDSDVYPTLRVLVVGLQVSL